MNIADTVRMCVYNSPECDEEKRYYCSHCFQVMCNSHTNFICYECNKRYCMLCTGTFVNRVDLYYHRKLYVFCEHCNDLILKRHMRKLFADKKKAEEDN